MTPVCNMPSATPSLSTLIKKGVTKVTYVAPDHFFSRSSAHFSVDPPTLSRMKSNLETRKEQAQSHDTGKIIINELTYETGCSSHFYLSLQYVKITCLQDSSKQTLWLQLNLSFTIEKELKLQAMVHSLHSR